MTTDAPTPPPDDGCTSSSWGVEQRLGPSSDDFPGAESDPFAGRSPHEPPTSPPTHRPDSPADAEGRAHLPSTTDAICPPGRRFEGRAHLPSTTDAICPPGRRFEGRAHLPSATDAICPTVMLRPRLRANVHSGGQCFALRRSLRRTRWRAARGPIGRLTRVPECPSARISRNHDPERGAERALPPPCLPRRGGEVPPPRPPHAQA